MLDLYDLEDRSGLDLPTVRFFLDRAPEQARTALIPFGYYRPEIHTELTTETQPWRAKLTINPGEPVRVASMAIHVLSERQPAELDFRLPPFPLSLGDRLDHQRYEAGKRTFRNALYDNGYLDIQPLTQEVRVDAERGEAYLTLVWDIGTRHRFGTVTFEGSQLSDRMMRRFLPFAAGDPYSQERLLELSSRLREREYFASVEVIPDLDRPDHTVPITVRVTPNARTVYRFGVNYGTDSGAGVEADARRRWMNREGHRGAASINLGQRRSEATLHYDVPSTSQYDAFYQLGASLSDEVTDSTESRSLRLGISRLRSWHGWRRTDAVNYLSEESLIGDEDIRSNFLIPAFSLSRTRSDGAAIPSSGYSLRGTIRGAVEGLVSDTSLVQLEVAAKRIYSPSANTRILLRGRLGLTWTERFGELPASLRFFSGGDRSIRGYDYESLGPRDEEGAVIGGRHLIELSGEYEFRVHGPWRGAVFLDGGNALSSVSDDLELGGGFGVRYASPIGLIRADLGFPISGDGGVRLHLVVGPDL